jgi:flagellar protein FlgJ
MRIDSNQIGRAIQLGERTAPKLKELKKATQSFEAVFLKKLFSTMREGVKHVKLGDSQGEDMYNDMFDQALAENATKTGSYGIGKMLYTSFAPKVVAMEELRMKAEQTVHPSIEPASVSGPTDPSDPRKEPLPRTPISNATDR